MRNSREEGRGCFVQTRETYYETQKVKKVYGYGKFKGFRLSDGTLIKAEDAIAYQTKDEYYKRMSDGETDSYALRTLKGRICFYYTTTYQRGPLIYNKTTGQPEATERRNTFRYIQKDNGNIYSFIYDHLRQLVSDYPPALEHLDKYRNVKPGKRADLMFDVMEEYNKAAKEGLIK